jgi:hypothetical protein
VHKAGQVAPRKAVLHGCDRALDVQRPGLRQDWLETDAVLVYGPQLDGGLREGDCNLLQQRAQTCLPGDLRVVVGPYMSRARLAPAGTEPP